MPRGGRRENAGKKSTWGSGRSFADTKVIRVPREFAEQLLGIAHKLDVGDAVDLDTKSIQEENEKLKQEVSLIRQRLAQSSEEIRRLKTEKETQPNQLELFSMNPEPGLPTKEVLMKLRDRCLKKLGLGEQSAQYVKTRKVFNEFINGLLSGKY